MKSTVVFVINGESIEVPELCWDQIEDTVMPILDAGAARKTVIDGIRDRIRILDDTDERRNLEAQADAMERPWYRSRGDDVRILAAAMRKPYEEVRRSLSMAEAREVSLNIGELLRISGFVMPGEAKATSDSTGISTGSSPDSSPEASPASPSGMTSSEP